MKILRTYEEIRKALKIKGVKVMVNVGRCDSYVEAKKKSYLKTIKVYESRGVNNPRDCDGVSAAIMFDADNNILYVGHL